MFLLEKLRALQRAKQNPSAPRGQGLQVSLIVQILLFQLVLGTVPWGSSSLADRLPFWDMSVFKTLCKFIDY